MELASRIVSVVLGVAVMVLLLWPITVPVGFGEAWWASRQAQSRQETQPAPRPQPEWAAARKRACAGAETPPPASTPARHAVTPSEEDGTKPAPVADEKAGARAACGAERQ